MLTSGFVVSRDDVCLGFVVDKTGSQIVSKIINNSKNGLPHPGGLGIHIRSGQLYIPNGRFLRMMLFTPTQNGEANDLQWDSENYPIVNRYPKATLPQLASRDVVIDGYCSLGKLLKHFGYDTQLNVNDISKIANQFFSRDFAFANCQLFGYEKVHPKELSGDDYDIYIPNTFKERGRVVIYKDDNIAYVKTSDGIFPSELFEFLCSARLLSNMGRDISVKECTENGIPADKFAPHGDELRRGKVRLMAPRRVGSN